MQTLMIILRDHRVGYRNLRLGQYFCDRYIKSSWPDLFYCEDYAKCVHLISKWLEDNQYLDSMPKTLKSFEEAYNVKAR